MSARGPRTRLALAALVLLVAACDAMPESVRVQGRRRRLASVGVESFDTTGIFKLAGISAVVDIDIEPFRMKDLAGDTLDPDFVLFSARCGACHDLPAPLSKEPWQWSGVVGRMQRHVEEAGLMPSSAEERAALQSYLELFGR